MSKTETLSLDLLTLNGDTQARVGSNEDTIEEYAELIKAAGSQWPFGPIDVYLDGASYFVADGFHRTLAAIKAGRASVPCIVKKGTKRDARIYGMTANDQHGLRMSREDRRKNVVWLLDTFPDMKHAEVAAKSGSGVRTVERIVGERKPANPPLAGSVNSKTGVPSPPIAETTRTTAPAAKAKADAVAEKLKAKEAAAVSKAEAKAAKEKAKLEAAGARQKIKDDAAEAKAEAKAAKEAAKAASLTTDGQVKNIKSLIQQHIGKLVRHLADLHRLKPNRSAFESSKKACEEIKTW